VSLWLACGAVLGGGLVPCALACLRRDPMTSIVALEVAGVVAALALIVLSVAFGRQGFADLGLVLVVMSFVGALAFLRFVERR
jgi:multisubunit Na+/H+ antiporter MnhF subunit